jgi:high-affinity iron transporter
MRGVSPYRAFFAITYGIQGTAMPPFSGLSEDDRWSLAYHVLALAHDGQVAAPAAEVLDAQALASLTEEDLQRSHAKLDEPARSRAIAYLRTVAPFESRPRALDIAFVVGPMLCLLAFLLWRKLSRRVGP